MRDEITLEQLLRIMVGQEIDVSDREIQQCITDLEDNVVVNSSWNLSHILMNLPDGATAAQIEETRKKAEDVYQQIVDGADFGEMAIRYSESDTSLRGGSLGWIEGQQIPSFFVDILTGMQAGDVSNPFRTSSSYHIVKVNELRSAIQRSEINQTHARHILITPNEIIDDATAKQQLENALERIEQGEEFGELAKLLSDGPTAPVGGDLGWSDPGSFVPEFEQIMNNLEIGEVSQPFRSPFGWHIVEVLERRVYDNTEDLKRRNCDLRIRNSKMEDETQLWMRRLRDEAFVVKRM
jgi:peptidyl-prolyl cis-trans isomerase SurA